MPGKRQKQNPNKKKINRSADFSRYVVQSGNRTQIMMSSGLFVALFAVLIVYLVHFAATSKEEMINNSYNSRQELLLSKNYRGTIYSRDGQVLALTIADSLQNETRVYPFSNIFSHVVGYSTQGRMGVEALANYYLINTNISLSSKVSNDMAGVKNQGDSVYTTLDVELQKLADTMLGDYRGAVVVTEVSTGRVLAMVSHPNFDPNRISDIWDSLRSDQNSSVLLNRATQGLYPPGSTFKIMTALEYIRQNPDIYEQYHFNCPGYYSLGSSRINCYHGNSHGKVDLTASYAKSCNAAFADIGISLDRNLFRETLDGLLFNRELPIALQYTKSSVQISNDITDSEMMQTAIGQGKTLITPMHLNMITCAIANDGVLMEPIFIDRVESDEGRVVKTFRPQTYGRLISRDEADILQEMMTAVVLEGTASKLDGQSYTAAGKTGSAEYNNVKGESHSWFTGYAPAQNPEICVTIIVEAAGSGSEYAVPMAGMLFDCYFEEKESQEELQ